MESVIISGQSKKSGKSEFEKTKLYESEKEIPGSVKGSHLEKMEEYRLKVRSYDSSNPDEYIRFSLGEGAGKDYISATLVNYYDSKKTLAHLGMKGGYPEYVISGVDENAKRSDSYRNCTCVIAAGEDVRTGKQISFMTHQNPSFAFSTASEDFKRDLGDTIREFLSRIKEGTEDVVILGGNYYESVNNENKNVERVFTNAEQYAESLPRLAELITSEFRRSGVEIPPVVLVGPDLSDPSSKFKEMDVVIDTQARLVVTARSKQFYQISDEVHDSSDTPAVLGILEENKIRVGKPFRKHRSDELLELANEKASRHVKGEEKDFVPRTERETYELLKSLKLPVFEKFERGNEADVGEINIGSKSEHDNMDLIYGDVASELLKKKIVDISNIQEFLDSAIADMVLMSEQSMEILSPQNSFLYYYGKTTGDISYLIGGIGGYMHIEKNTENREDALVRNVANFMKSFHTFIDSFAKPEHISKYMEIFQVHGNAQ
ncbi:MAG: hypothetical protein JWM20_182 [Patescibacteria group bacterium]|nr:hypothetical protein [Patescibacteria group bacterium]